MSTKSKLNIRGIENAIAQLRDRWRKEKVIPFDVCQHLSEMIKRKKELEKEVRKW